MGEIALNLRWNNCNNHILEMHKALRNTNRNIVFTLPQYGMGNACGSGAIKWAVTSGALPVI